jgi:type IV pilus assembly protein PilE
MQRPTQSVGFTLVELIVALTIISILLAIAVPMYKNYILAGHRAEAYQALLQLEQREQRYYLFNNTYASSTSTLNVGSLSNTGLYSLSISSATTTGYTATAIASGSQTSDSSCLTLQLIVATSTVTYSPQSCWSQ